MPLMSVQVVCLAAVVIYSPWLCLLCTVPFTSSKSEPLSPPAPIRLKMPLMEWLVNRLSLCGLCMQRKAAGSGKVSNKRFINIHHTRSINKLHTCLIPKWWENNDECSFLWTHCLRVDWDFYLTPNTVTENIGLIYNASLRCLFL